MKVASGRASGVKRAKSMMRDRLAVATPDKRERPKEEEEEEVRSGEPFLIASRGMRKGPAI